MKIAPEHIAAIQSFGYTLDEARFLYIVATFSGYFLPRQFIAFAGVKWGKRSTRFTEKVESRGHASWREYPHLDGVYHLSSRTLFRVIDKENLRNHRRHSVEFIRKNLVLLDFVLANQHYNYLETELDRLRYFHDVLGLPKDVLPAKAFGCSYRSEPTVRYFIDRSPIFFESSASDKASPVIFSYVDPGEATLAGFQRHLAEYKQLFRWLSDLRIVYISNSPVHFTAAEQRFAAFVERGFRDELSEELVRYFTLRHAWEQKQYPTISNADVEWLEKASKRLMGSEIERLYDDWRGLQRLDPKLRNQIALERKHQRTCFTPFLVGSRESHAKELEGTG
jgi:hypothetical protein